MLQEPPEIGPLSTLSIHQRTLVHWEQISAVFETNPKWTMGSFWAPELYYMNGTFYCYYTARGTDGISKIGVATTKDIAKGFKDMGVLIDWGDEAIDAYVFQENDKIYITWKAYGLTPDKPIQILGSELSKDGLSLIGDHFNLVTAEEGNWEKGGIEGQAIIKRDDFLYMLYSGNACCGKDCDYMVGVARAKSIKGPWEKHDLNPILSGNSQWKCPGHGTATTFNDDWYYLYHGYNTKGFPRLGRAALLSRLYWNEETGWPSFRVEPDVVNGNRVTHDFIDNFKEDNAGYKWKYNVKNNPFTAEIKNNRLTLSESQPDSENPTGTVLCVIPDDAYFKISTKVLNVNKALKGLVLYTTKNNSLGLGLKDGTIVIWKVQDGSYNEIVTKQLPTFKNGVWLKVAMNPNNTIDMQYSTDNKQWKTLKAPNGENLAWWSSGMKAGLQVRKDTSSNDNQAIFDSFSIQY
ncbi:family 43 glycosylhydrolase [Maribacter litopenaei]|uniref:Family 43 glycosylhydrolase n=1 Tax=Maribacter litopenaei TaxID=2976127 RepID=A0ABY5YBV7_9FLAO|nr:glycoside hydrolase family 43 protein [Maribacter litopenaei]UWX56331.1 family 43 glycosylhydrolase [Maribacter litopenaei]